MFEEKLNSNQKKAVEYVSGPLIIVAGAGTGKTTVITKKIARLIDEKLAKPEEILALTFTDKAADEMQERVDSVIDTGYIDLQISTFHSFCQKILETHGIDIGLSNKFKLLTGTDAWMLVRQNLDKFNLDYYRPLGNPSGHIHELVSHFSKCKDELISPEEYLEYAEEIKLNKDDANTDEKSRLSEISGAYHAYNQLLLDNNALDFGDLIFYTIKLLETRPSILNSLRKRFKFILIDEFQDVNWAQYQLVRLLAGSGAQLTVVGDDDQSIYAFRGASVSNILRFKDDYPDAEEIVLNENYRSNQEILDLAYKLIQNNNPDRLEAKLKIDKKLIAKVTSSKEKSVAHIHCSTIDEEAKAVAEEIKKIKNADKDAVWDDFAILVRANNHSEPFISALEKEGIPYEYLAASGLYRQPLVLDCVNYFRLLDNYHESSAVYRMLCMPVWKLDEHDIQKITSLAKKKSMASYYEAVKKSRELGVSESGIAICDKIVNMIHDGMRKTKSEKPSVIMYFFLEQSGYLEFLIREENAGNPDMIRQIYHLTEFFNYIGKYETANPGANLAGFLEHFNYVLESGDQGALYQPKDTPDSVNIVTVHKAKGLEFKYVFVVNLVEDRFPARKRGEGIEIPAELIREQLPEGDGHFQEERRLFYVAITRAKEKLYLMSAGDYGGARTKKISRFLNELGFAAGEKNTGESKKILHESGQTVREAGEFVYELPAAFSFSQIKSYNTCPYQYKLSHILHIPTKGSAVFSFGQSMHGTMQKFYQRMQEMNKVEQGSLFGLPGQPEQKNTGGIKAPELSELMDFYDQSWIGDWYKNSTQKDEYYKKGKEILRVFYESEKNNWTIPITLEGWFKIKVGDYLVHGRIDRIDRMPDGGLEIIDYKTGAGKEDLESEDKDQLLIYQMAAQQLPEYRNVGPTGKLTYFYLNDNLKVSFLGKDKELEKLQDKLIKNIGDIHSGNFSATPNQHKCKFCDFKDICEFRV